MTEYEIELKDLANFVPKLASTEEMLCLKFQEGLSLNFREKMVTSSKQSYKEMV